MQTQYRNFLPYKNGNHDTVEKNTESDNNNLLSHPNMPLIYDILIGHANLFWGEEPYIR